MISSIRRFSLGVSSSWDLGSLIPVIILLDKDKCIIQVVDDSCIVAGSDYDLVMLKVFLPTFSLNFMAFGMSLF